MRGEEGDEISLRRGGGVTIPFLSTIYIRRSKIAADSIECIMHDRSFVFWCRWSELSESWLRGIFCCRDFVQSWVIVGRCGNVVHVFLFECSCGGDFENCGIVCKIDDGLLLGFGGREF